MTQSDSASAALRAHRRRNAQKGLCRVEVSARKQDAPLIREIARTLREAAPDSNGLRERLQAALAAPAQGGLKALLAAAPLDDIRITRSRDRGRAVDL